MKSKLVICGLFFFALLLRLKGISQVSFWHDELWTTAYWTNPNTLSQVWEVLWLPIEANLPLYPLFINIWSSIFGISELSLVLPSVIAGSLSVVAIYLLGKKIFTSFEGIVAAVLLGVLLIPLYFSHEVRCYSFIILLVVLNLFFRYSKNNIGWIVTSILLCWIHYFGILFIVLVALLELIKERKLSKHYLYPIISLVPLAPLIYFQLHHGPTIYPDLSWGEIASLPLWMLDSGFSVVTVILSCLLGLMILLVLLFKAWRKNHETDLVYFFGAPLAVTLLTHFFIKSTYEERYLVILLPPAILLISRSLGALRTWAPKTLLVLTFALLSVATAGALMHGDKPAKDYAKLKESLDFIAHSSTCEKNLLVEPKNLKLWGYYLARYKQLNLLSSLDGLKNQTFWVISLDISDEEVQAEQAEYASKYEVIHKHQIDETESVCFMSR